MCWSRQRGYLFGEVSSALTWHARGPGFESACRNINTVTVAPEMVLPGRIVLSAHLRVVSTQVLEWTVQYPRGSYGRNCEDCQCLYSYCLVVKLLVVLNGVSSKDEHSLDRVESMTA